MNGTTEANVAELDQLIIHHCIHQWASYIIGKHIIWFGLCESEWFIMTIVG